MLTDRTTQPLFKHNTTKTPNANPSNTPLFPIALRLKSQLSHLLTRGHQVPASLSHHFSTRPPASSIRSCLQFLSCLRLFSSSELCLHHALCLECPSPNFRLAKTFLSFGDAATASEPCIVNLNCPCTCLCPCPNPTISPVIAFVPSYPRDSDSPHPGTGSHSQL